MDHFIYVQVRIGAKEPAAQYVVCIPKNTLSRELESPNSKLKKHPRMDTENETQFMARSAAILGGIICSEDCSLRFNQWVLAEIPQATILPHAPDDLGEPVPSMLENEYQGIRMWLVKAWIDRLPSLCC